MLIRSQDKKSLFNLDNIQWFETESTGKVKLAMPGCDAYIYIGKYSTEAKAINVLDMIQDFYICCQSMQVVNGNPNKILKQAIIDKIGESELFVFQMPLDEGVEG